MGFAVAYNPCEWCPYKESGERCAMCELTFRRKEWISVDERLPEETCECLIVDTLGVIYLASYSSRYRAFNATDEDDGDTWRLNNITHWMPLPEAPMMKGGAE